MKQLLYILPLFFLLTLCQCTSDNVTSPVITHDLEDDTVDAGKLFIIGGGSRSQELIQRMVKAADLKVGDHVVILPMASSEPDSACFYIKKQLQLATEADINCLKLSQKDTSNVKALDEVRHADLIYICGGDQNRFMEVVRGNAIHKAIQTAYREGALVAGSSAGAAMMSQIMITGDQRKTEDYESTYSRVETKNGIYAPGLGLLKNAVIDQHFIARSRYNRALTALYDHPGKSVFGIDEGTALLIDGTHAEVVGVAQVVVFQSPESTKAVNEIIGLNNVRMDVYVQGDKFERKK
jgi:cyanophycinase